MRGGLIASLIVLSTVAAHPAAAGVRFGVAGRYEWHVMRSEAFAVSEIPEAPWRVHGSGDLIARWQHAYHLESEYGIGWRTLSGYDAKIVTGTIGGALYDQVVGYEVDLGGFEFPVRLRYVSRPNKGLLFEGGIVPTVWLLGDRSTFYGPLTPSSVANLPFARPTTALFQDYDNWQAFSQYRRVEVPTSLGVGYRFTPWGSELDVAVRMQSSWTSMVRSGPKVHGTSVQLAVTMR